jgi:APA family basic amino acid/polyamine antiporter
MYVQSVWASLLILTGTFEQLVIFSGFILSAFTALTIGAVIVLRRRRPDLARPYRVPFYPVLPAIVILVLLIVVGTSLVQRPFESALGLAAILAGWPF